MPEIKKIGQFTTNAQPDSADLRDRIYNPTLRLLEPSYNASPFSDPAWKERVRHQGTSNACTGFALAGMVEALRDTAWRSTKGQQWPPAEISPFMLYYFARRYDEIPGADDAGSTARGAMKAWNKHGACQWERWPVDVGTDSKPKDKDWVKDAFGTRLGAYFRVDHRSIPDMHAAINETGVILVTAQIHDGWRAPRADGEIVFASGTPQAGGHAFLVVGYDQLGFWVQNSWGATWGQKGFARLTYTDWHENSMDAWVGQLAVQVSHFMDTLDQGLSLDSVRTGKKGGSIQGSDLLSGNAEVSAQQINPYIIDLENNGTLSDRGNFATRREDLEDMLSHNLPAAVADWGLTGNQPIDVAVYCHGGLTPEAGAAQTARTWVPALYAAQIFPVFIMWETGWDDILKDIFADVLQKIRGAAGASFWGNVIDKVSGWLGDERMENLLSGPGTLEWDEMKENAEAGSTNPGGGLHALYQILLRQEHAALIPRLRFHLIGHSAGAVFHSNLAPHLIDGGLKVDGLYFMAPACRSELFIENVLPHYASGKIQSYAQFHLTDQVEQQDTCMNVYHKSLLYLVSNAFEHRRGTPILGMEKFFRADPRLATKPARAAVWDAVLSPTGPKAPVKARSNSTSHGGFDNDEDTRNAIIARIVERKGASGKAAGARPPTPKKPGAVGDGTPKSGPQPNAPRGKPAGRRAGKKPAV